MKTFNQYIENKTYLQNYLGQSGKTNTRLSSTMDGPLTQEIQIVVRQLAYLLNSTDDFAKEGNEDMCKFNLKQFFSYLPQLERLYKEIP